MNDRADRVARTVAARLRLTEDQTRLLGVILGRVAGRERKRCAAVVELYGDLMTPKRLADRLRKGTR